VSETPCVCGHKESSHVKPSLGGLTGFIGCVECGEGRAGFGCIFTPRAERRAVTDETTQGAYTRSATANLIARVNEIATERVYDLTALHGIDRWEAERDALTLHEVCERLQRAEATVAALQADKDRAQKENAELREDYHLATLYGRQLANAAYNLAQREHLTSEERETLDACRKQWDAMRERRIARSGAAEHTNREAE